MLDAAANVLILDDDPALRSVLARALREEGYDVTAVGSGSDLLTAIERRMPAAMILDVGLPDCDGRDVCSTVRARDPHVPVLFLTARDTLSDRLSGFDAGADDYIVKPFALGEVLARLEAVLRRSSRDRDASAPQAAGKLLLDPASFRVTLGTNELKLTPTEFRLLARLLAADGEVVSRVDLKRAGWPRTGIVNENTLDTYIARLRRRLRELPRAAAIETVPYAGYRYR